MTKQMQDDGDIYEVEIWIPMLKHSLHGKTISVEIRSCISVINKFTFTVVTALVWVAKQPHKC